jgi:hypothetical protein
MAESTTGIRIPQKVCQPVPRHNEIKGISRSAYRAKTVIEALAANNLTPSNGDLD